MFTLSSVYNDVCSVVTSNCSITQSFAEVPDVSKKVQLQSDRGVLIFYHTFGGMCGSIVERHQSSENICLIRRITYTVISSLNLSFHYEKARCCRRIFYRTLRQEKGPTKMKHCIEPSICRRCEMSPWFPAITTQFYTCTLHIYEADLQNERAGGNWAVAQYASCAEKVPTYSLKFMGSKIYCMDRNRVCSQRYKRANLKQARWQMRECVKGRILVQEAHTMQTTDVDVALENFSEVFQLLHS